jgi:hypothetical protein
MKRILAAMTAALMMVALVSGTAFAAKPTFHNSNLLKSTAYYVVNDGATWCRSHSPIASTNVVGGGTASQSRNGGGNGPLSLSITNAGGYADNGFYVPLGTLGSLVGYSFTSSGSAVGTNLYFGTTNGDFFVWTGNCLSGYGNTSVGLGPTGTGTVTVTGSSTFNLTCNGTYQTVTFAQLTAGFCSEIPSTTQVAVWIGITAASGGSLSTTITSAQATFAP